MAQFYATLFIEESGRTIHWHLGGKRFTYNMAQFSILFGHTGHSIVYVDGYIVDRDDSKVDLHVGNELEPSKMHFMYDRAYGDIVYGQVKGITPYYRLFNTLFRFTLTPRGGDSDNISHRAKNLLAQMAPGKPKFAVMEFIWNEKVVAQFYATLFIEENERIIHWHLRGKRFTYNMADFSILFGHTGNSVFFGGSYVVNRDDSKVDLHAGNELEPSKMHFMYDRAYGDYSLWTVQGTHSLL